MRETKSEIERREGAGDEDYSVKYIKQHSRHFPLSLQLLGHRVR